MNAIIKMRDNNGDIILDDGEETKRLVTIIRMYFHENESSDHEIIQAFEDYESILCTVCNWEDAVNVGVKPNTPKFEALVYKSDLCL